MLINKKREKKLQTYVALRRHSQSSSLWDKTSQHHLASLAAAVVPN